MLNPAPSKILHAPPGPSSNVNLVQHEIKRHRNCIFPLRAYRSSWVEICGTKYSRCNVVLDSSLLPVFGNIHDVLNDVHQPLLVCEKLITDCFSSHYDAYEIIRPNPPVFCICKQSQFYDYSVLSITFSLPFLSQWSITLLIIWARAFYCNTITFEKARNLESGLDWAS